MPHSCQKPSSIFKSSKISGHLLLRDSRDPLVSSSVPTLKAGSWDIKKTIKVAEDDLAFQKILGHIQYGRSGLGLNKIANTPPKQCHEYRRLVSKASKEIEEENSFAKAVQLQVQGQWTRRPCHKVCFLSALVQLLILFHLPAIYKDGISLLNHHVSFVEKRFALRHTS